MPLMSRVFLLSFSCHCLSGKKKITCLREHRRKMAAKHVTNNNILLPARNGSFSPLMPHLAWQVLSAQPQPRKILGSDTNFVRAKSRMNELFPQQTCAH